MNIIDPNVVINHSLKKKRKPSLGYLEIRNPNLALQKAKLYLKVIEDLFKSKKSEKSKLSEILFCDNKVLKYGLSDFSVKIFDRKGQVEFYAITEDGKVLDYNFLNSYSAVKKLRHDFVKSYCVERYYLSDLFIDLVEIDKQSKLVYLILTNPELKEFNVLPWKKFRLVKIKGASQFEFTEVGNDIVDNYYKRMSKVKNPCPNCADEWDGNFCRYCGHPH